MTFEAFKRVFSGMRNKVAEEEGKEAVAEEEKEEKKEEGKPAASSTDGAATAEEPSGVELVPARDVEEGAASARL